MGTATSAIPWPTVAQLRWGTSRAAATEAPHCRALRTRLVIELILLRRLGHRGDCPADERWLGRHPAMRDFLRWCVTDAGSTARLAAHNNIGRVLDIYLGELWGKA